MILVITGVALFMTGLDNLVVTVALPTIRETLDVSVSDLSWTVNAYTMTFAVFMLGAASVGNRFGRRNSFSVGIVLFTLSSAMVALSGDLLTFGVARAFQGLGAALMVPLAFTLVGMYSSSKRRPIYLGVLGGISGLAVALGPFIGGLIVAAWTWQTIFWVNVPIGVLLAAITLMALPSDSRTAARVDYAGFFTLAGGMFFIVLGVLSLSQDQFGAVLSVGLILAGIAVVGVFVWLQKRSASPLLPGRLMRSRGLMLSVATAFFGTAGVFGAIFVLMQYLQLVLGFGASETGVATLPWTLVPLVAAPLAGIAASKVGMKTALVVGAILQCSALGWFTVVISPDVTYPMLVPGMVLAGLGMGVFFALVTGQAMALVSREDDATASGLSNAARELGVLVGIATVSVVFAVVGGGVAPAEFAAATPAVLLVAAALQLVSVITAVCAPDERDLNGTRVQR
jgi:EmrB/QacA subfamily drug resistance transporter